MLIEGQADAARRRHRDVVAFAGWQPRVFYGARCAYTLGDVGRLAVLLFSHSGMLAGHHEAPLVHKIAQLVSRLVARAALAFCFSQVLFRSARMPRLQRFVTRDRLL
jgi:hypothetical protein